MPSGTGARTQGLEPAGTAAASPREIPRPVLGGADGRLEDAEHQHGQATTKPASGPAMPMSKSARRLGIGPRMRMKAPKRADQAEATGDGAGVETKNGQRRRRPRRAGRRRSGPSRARSGCDSRPSISRTPAETLNPPSLVEPADAEDRSGGQQEQGEITSPALPRDGRRQRPGGAAATRSRA